MNETRHLLRFYHGNPAHQQRNLQRIKHQVQATREYGKFKFNSCFERICRWITPWWWCEMAKTMCQLQSMWCCSHPMKWNTRLWTQRIINGMQSTMRSSKSSAVIIFAPLIDTDPIGYQKKKTRMTDEIWQKCDFHLTFCAGRSHFFLPWPSSLTSHLHHFKTATASCLLVTAKFLLHIWISPGDIHACPGARVFCKFPLGSRFFFVFVSILVKWSDHNQMCRQRLKKYSFFRCFFVVV